MGSIYNNNNNNNNNNDNNNNHNNNNNNNNIYIHTHIRSFDDSERSEWMRIPNCRPCAVPWFL